MKDQARAEREERIAQATYELLEERGYSGTSMLAIAKKARASNETLYNWYGDKLGLFKALVGHNAREVKALLVLSLEKHSAPLSTLQALGPKLLDLLLSERAIALNRAAASDATGEMGAALSTAGRENIMPLIQRVLTEGREAEEWSFDQVSDASELYMNLLVGDLQIRRVIGQMAPLNKADTVTRATRALQHFLTLSPANNQS